MITIFRYRLLQITCPLLVGLATGPCMSSTLASCLHSPKTLTWMCSSTACRLLSSAHWRNALCQSFKPCVCLCLLLHCLLLQPCMSSTRRPCLHSARTLTRVKPLCKASWLHSDAQGLSDMSTTVLRYVSTSLKPFVCWNLHAIPASAHMLLHQPTIQTAS